MVWWILFMIWYIGDRYIWVLNGPISGENTKPLQRSDIYIYENSAAAKDTRTRENLYFFFHLPFVTASVPPVIEQIRHTEYLFLLFSFPSFFFLPRPPVVVVDCEFNLSRGLRRAETGNCGVLPNRIVNPTNRTGDDGIAAAAAAVAVKEIATKRWLTRVMHRPYLSRLTTEAPPPRRQSYRFKFRA